MREITEESKRRGMTKHSGVLSWSEKVTRVLSNWDSDLSLSTLSRKWIMIPTKGDLDWSRRDVTNCEYREISKNWLIATLLVRGRPTVIANSNRRLSRLTLSLTRFIFIRSRNALFYRTISHPWFHTRLDPFSSFVTRYFHALWVSTQYAAVY